MPPTEFKILKVSESDLQSYLDAELVAGRWLLQSNEGSGPSFQDRGFGHAAGSRNVELITQKNSNRIPTSLKVHLRVPSGPELDAVLLEEATAHRELFYRNVEWIRSGISQMDLIFYGFGEGAQQANPQPVTTTLSFSIPAGGQDEKTVPMPGAALGDVVVLGIPVAAMVPGVGYTGYVSTTDVVTVRATNSTGSPVTPSGSFKVAIIKT